MLRLHGSRNQGCESATSLERASALDGEGETLRIPFVGDSHALDHVEAWAHGAGDLSGDSLSLRG